MKTALSHQKNGVTIILSVLLVLLFKKKKKSVVVIESHSSSCGFKSILEIYFPVSAHMEGGEMNVAY